MYFIKKHLLLIFFSFIGILFTYNLWTPRIYFSDELLIEDISYTMSKSGNFLIPFFNSQPHFVKPPLLYWITAPLYYFFPPLHWLVRLWMPLFGIFLVLVTYNLSKEWYGNKLALSSAFLLATSIPLLYFTKTANFDLPNAFFFTATIYFYNLAKNKKVYIYFAAVTAGLGIMDRSYFALIPFGIIFLDNLISIKKIPFKFILKAFIVVILIILPWHIAAFIKYPKAFLSDYLFFPLQSHFFHSFWSDTPSSPLSVLIIFLYFPFTFFLFFLNKYTFLKKNHSAFIQLAIWIGSICVIFLFSQSRNDWYLLPIFPALAIAAAGVILDIFQTTRHQSKTYFLVWFFIFVFVFIPVGIIFNSSLPQSEAITSAEVMEKKSSKKDILYMWHYSLFPVTRFFPSRRVILLEDNSINNSERKYPVKFLLLRKKDFSEGKINFLYKILFKTNSLLLIYVNR